LASNFSTNCCLVEVGLPVKQGLKQPSCYYVFYQFLQVEVGLPVKQGLKLNLSLLLVTRSNRVEVGLPVKQGLKLALMQEMDSLPNKLK